MRGLLWAALAWGMAGCFHIDPFVPDPGGDGHSGDITGDAPAPLDAAAEDSPGSGAVVVRDCTDIVDAGCSGDGVSDAKDSGETSPAPCVPTDPCTATQCQGSDLWCMDDCGKLDHVQQVCGTAGCLDGVCLPEGSRCPSACTHGCDATGNCLGGCPIFPALADPLDPKLWETAFADDFEADPLGQYPAQWTVKYHGPFDQPGNSVVVDPVDSGNHVLVATGKPNDCWVSIFDGPVVPADSILLFSADIMGSGAIEGMEAGCHKRDILVSLRTTSGGWNDDGNYVVSCGVYVGDVYGDGVGELFMSGWDAPADYEQWYHFDYVIDPQNLQACAFVDGAYVGSTELPSDLSPPWKVTIESGDGHGWVDNIRVSTLVESR